MDAADGGSGREMDAEGGTVQFSSNSALSAALFAKLLNLSMSAALFAKLLNRHFT